MFSQPVKTNDTLQSFMKPALPKENKEITKYLDNFQLYYSKNGLILKIKSYDFYKGTLDHKFDDNIIALFPFLKNYNDQLHVDMHFWSPDGNTFYQMEQKLINNDISSFATPPRIDGSEKFCRIEFTKEKAALLEPEIRENKKHTSEKEEMIEWNWDFHIRRASSPQPPPPIHKKLMEFDRAPKSFINALLQSIHNNEIHFIRYHCATKPMCLIQFGDIQLFYGKSDVDKFKFKENNIWTDLPCKTGIGVMDGSGSIAMTMHENHKFKKFVINNPHTSSCTAGIRLQNDRVIEGQKVDLTEEALKSLGNELYQENSDLRPTPLDFIEQELSMQNKLK